MSIEGTAAEESATRPAEQAGPQPYLQRMDLALERLFNLSHELLGIAGFDGYFKQINPSWERTLGWSDAEVLGQPYLDLVHPDDRDLTADEAEGLVDGITTLRFENRYRCADGSYRWISWTATPSEAEGLIYCAGRDVTEIKRIAQISEAKLAVGAAAAVATEWRQAAPSILRAISECLGMDIGEEWRVSADSDVLHWVTAWRRPRRQLSRFARLGRQGVRRPGEGLVGGAYEAAAPVVIADVTGAGESEFPRAAEALRQGLHGGLAIPLHSGDKVVGVMAFFGPEILPLDATLRSSLAELGALVSSFKERVSIDEKVRQMAFFDGLTGLPNRTLFFDRAREAIELARRTRRRARILVLDLDGFKQVNDTFGHAAGDEVLREAAQRMTSCLRTSDTVARLGGDEFGVVGVTDNSPGENQRIARKLAAALQEPYELQGASVSLTGSIGATTARGRLNDISRLLSEADAAMYEGKRTGSGFAEHRERTA